MAENKKEKVVVLTGGNQGIGYFLSTSLLKKGYRVAVLDLTGDNLGPILHFQKEQFLFFSCDITREELVQATIKQIIQSWGRIDILVNNACLCHFQSFPTRTISSIQDELDVNLLGMIRMIKAVLPIMKEQGSGIIHNVSSGAGITGMGGISGYAASKGAIEAFTRSLSYELPPYIHVHLLHPPLTKTNSTASMRVPDEFKADPAIIGKAFARQIESNKFVITSNLQTSIYLFLSHRFPSFFGRLMSKGMQGNKTEEKG